MNVNTGDLYKFLTNEQLDELGDTVQRLPDELQLEALKELGDKDYVKVDMNKKSPLVDWAKKQQKKKKRKTAKASRKANRRFR